MLGGTSATTFSPNGSMTRGMFGTALYRLAGSPQAASEGEAFTDVPASAYYAAAVQWASKNSIVNGIGGGKFDPTATATRTEVATMLRRYVELAQ